MSEASESGEGVRPSVKRVVVTAVRGVGEALRGTALAQVRRVRVASDKRTAMEQKGLDWARTAIDEGARLSKATLEYSVQLGAAWRTLSLDAMRAMLGGQGDAPGAQKG